jgi:DNA-binding MarR family transcriptional regulator
MPREPAVAPLAAHLGYWLRFVSNHVSHAFALKLEGEGVTVAEWVILRELYDEVALSPGRLAQRLSLSRGAVSKLADRLVAKGLVTREASPEDARAQTLSLSGQGRRLTPRLSALADRNDAEFFDHLTPEQRATIEDMLRDVIARRGLDIVPMS